MEMDMDIIMVNLVVMYIDKNGMYPTNVHLEKNAT